MKRYTLHDLSRSLLLAGAGTAALAALTFTTPTSAAAQVCIGSAAASGQNALGGTYLRPHNGTGYGVHFQSNPAGPIGFGSEIHATDLDNVEERAITVGGHLAWELGSTNFSICPVVTPNFSWWDDQFGGVEFEANQLQVPAGLAVGRRLWLGDGSMALTPTAMAGAYYQRIRRSVSDTGDNLELADTASDTEFFGDLGATLELGRVYLRGSVRLDTVDDRDAAFRLGAGVVF